MRKMNSEKEKIEGLLKKLEDFKKFHLEIAMEMSEADQGNIYPMDLFALGIIKRSLMLVNGFCTLVKKNNFTSAAPLVRLQLDNLLQIFAAFVVENPHDFAMEKLKGKQTNNLKDKDGNKLTDGYLAELLSKEEETSWVKQLYKEASKFIHFSDKHIFSTVMNVKEDGRTKILISSEEEIIPDSAKLEIVMVMTKITNQLFRYLYGWVITKNGKSIKD